MDYDYIIVGAGAAGCVVANRLSADPKNEVLLLEYGGPDTNPMIHVPKGFYFTLRGSRYTYHYQTQPVGPGGQVEGWTHGKVLGGSTAINGMMWTRGAAADYDGLVDRGNSGWGWDHVLPAFKAMEDHELGASDMRGSGGPLGEVISQGPLADYILDEEFPGPSVSTPEEVLRYSIDTGAGIFHAVGANAMGPDDDVVDPQLRVWGVTGMRIADASVLPAQVSGNTAAPTMAVGWLASDLILDDI
jgi:choline dehydrogenase-like flavoprotein